MIIREIQQKDLPGNQDLYLSSNWIDLYNDQILVYGVFDNNNDVIGGFILQRVKIKGLNSLINPLFISNNCLYVKHQSVKLSSKISFEKKLFNAFATFLSERKERILDFSFPSKYSDMQALQWKGILVKPRYTYKVDLTNTEDELWDSLDGSTRANIKKAQSDGLEIKDGKCEELLIMTDKTFDRQSESYHRDLLIKIANSENLKDNRRIFVTEGNGKNYAAVMIVYDDQTAYYTIGGYDHEMNHRGGMALAMWNAILFARSKGIKTFDFQGSMLPQVEKFVRGFGGELHTYYRVSKIPFWVNLSARIIGKKIGG